MHSVQVTILRLALVGAGLLALPASGSAHAGSRLALSGLVGPSPYDLSGTGPGFAAAIEFSWRPVTGLVIEPELTYFTYESQFSERTLSDE